MTKLICLINAALFLSLTACSGLPTENPTPRSPASTKSYSSCRLNNADFPISLIRINGDDIAVEIKSVPFAGSMTKIDGYGSAKNNDIISHYARLVDTAQEKVLSFWIEKINDKEIILREVGLAPTQGRNPKQLAIGENTETFLKPLHTSDNRGAFSNITCARFE